MTNLDLSYAWMVPVSSQTGIAHYMPESAHCGLVKPLCGHGRFNPNYAEIISHAKLCQKCLEAQIAMEEKS